MTAARLLICLAGLSLVSCGPHSSGYTRSQLSETEQVAQAALAVGDPQEAARLYELAASRQPDSIEALLGLGRSYAALGQFSRAANALDRAAALKPGNPQVQCERGRLALLQGDAGRALTSFDAALALQPRDLAALTGRAVALDYLSRHDEAQETYRRGLQYHPTNFALLSNQALSLVLSDNSAEGIRLMEELLQDAGHGETVRANLAIAYALEGRTGDARAMLKGVLNADEAEAALAVYAQARKDRAAGLPIGHLIFS